MSISEESIKAAAEEIDRLDAGEEGQEAMRAFEGAADELSTALKKARASTVALLMAVESASSTCNEVSARTQAFAELDEAIDRACSNMVRLREANGQ